MQIIYIDTLFFTNFIINYLALLATAKVCGVCVSRLRIALGAAVGGLYSVLVVFPLFGFLLSPWVKIAVGVLMLLTAFGGAKGLFRICLIFFAVSALFAGAVLALTLLGGGGVFEGTVYMPVTLKVLIPSFAVCYALVTLLFKRMGKAVGESKISELVIELGGRSVTLRALVDTGNSLSDPLTGSPVAVVEAGAVISLFDGSVRRLLAEDGATNPIAFLESLSAMGIASGFRLIPYSAVGVSGGFLLGFKPDRISADGKTVLWTVALSPTTVSDVGIYSALISNYGG